MFQYQGDRKYLVRHPFAGSGDGKTYGAAIIPGPHNMLLKIIFSDGDGWEHVSVSCQNRMPNWPEMCFIKDLFWDSEDCVVQYHPPGSKYVNYHPLVLHLWRPVGKELPLPDPILVGPKNGL